MSEDILDHSDGGLLTITLNRPEQGNGLNDTAIAELTALLQGAAARARLVVLKAAGNDFCVGRIAPRGAAAPKLEALQVRRGRDVIFNCYAAFRESPIPIISAVNGRALGFGCAIAACADITIAAESAIFQMPEFGENIMPTIAMSALLGESHAKTADVYCLFHRSNLAPSAPNESASSAKSRPRVHSMPRWIESARKILKAPQPAVLAIKEFARVAPSMDIKRRRRLRAQPSRGDQLFE